MLLLIVKYLLRHEENAFRGLSDMYFLQTIEHELSSGHSALACPVSLSKSTRNMYCIVHILYLYCTVAGLEKKLLREKRGNVELVFL